eukprot:scaffold704_cov347-Prasinococcus_capsulatus_cf.AAC.1
MRGTRQPAVRDNRGSDGARARHEGSTRRPGCLVATGGSLRYPQSGRGVVREGSVLCGYRNRPHPSP